MSTPAQPKHPIEFVDTSTLVSHQQWVNKSKDAVLVMPVEMRANRPAFSLSETEVLPEYETMCPVGSDIANIEFLSAETLSQSLRQIAYHIGAGKRVIIPNQGSVDLSTLEKNPAQLNLFCGNAKPENFDKNYQQSFMVLCGIISLFNMAKQLKDVPEDKRVEVLKQQKVSDKVHDIVLKITTYLDDKTGLPIFGKDAPQDVLLEAMKTGMKNGEAPSPFTNWTYRLNANDYEDFFSDPYTKALERDNETFVNHFDNLDSDQKQKAKSFLAYYCINCDELFKIDNSRYELREKFVTLIQDEAALSNQGRLTLAGEKSFKALCVRALQMIAAERKNVRDSRGHGILQAILGQKQDGAGYYSNDELMDAGDIETTLKTYCTQYQPLGWSGMSRLLHVSLDPTDITKAFHFVEGEKGNSVLLFNPIGVSVEGHEQPLKVWDSFAENIKKIIEAPQFETTKTTKIYLPVFKDDKNYLLVAEHNPAKKILKLRLQDSTEQLVPMEQVVDPGELKQRLQAAPAITRAYNEIFIRVGNKDAENIKAENIASIGGAMLRAVGHTDNDSVVAAHNSRQYHSKKPYQFSDDNEHVMVAKTLIKSSDDKDAFAYDNVQKFLAKIVKDQAFSRKKETHVYFPLRHANHFYVAKFSLDPVSNMLLLTLQNPYSKALSPDKPEFFASLQKTAVLCAENLGYEVSEGCYQTLGYQPRGDVSCGFIATAAILKQCGVADDITQALPETDDQDQVKREKLNKLRLAVAKKIIRDSSQAALANQLVEEDGVIRNWRKATTGVIKKDKAKQAKHDKILQRTEEQNSYFNLIPRLDKIRSVDPDLVSLQGDKEKQQDYNVVLSYGDTPGQQVGVNRHPGSDGSIKFEVVGSKLKDLSLAQQKQVFRKILKLVYAERAQLFEDLGGIDPTDKEKGITLDLTMLTGVFNDFTSEDIKEIAFNLFEDDDNKSFASIKIRKGAAIANPRFAVKKADEKKQAPEVKEKELKERAKQSFAEETARTECVASMPGLITHKGVLKTLVDGIKIYPELVAAFIDEDEEFVASYKKDTPLEQQHLAEFKKLLVAASREGIKRLVFGPLPEKDTDDYEALYSFLLGLQVPKEYLKDAENKLAGKLADLDKERSWFQALHLTDSNVAHAAQSLGLPGTTKKEDVEKLVRMLAAVPKNKNTESTLASFQKGISTASSYHDMSTEMLKEKGWFEKSIYEFVVSPVIDIADTVTQVVAKPLNAVTGAVAPKARDRVAGMYHGMVQETRESLKNPVEKAVSGFMLAGPWGAARNFLPGPLKYAAFGWGLFKLTQPVFSVANNYVITPVAGKVVAGAAMVGVDGTNINNYVVQPLIQAGQLAVDGAYAAPAEVVRLAYRADRLLRIEEQNTPEWVMQQRNMTRPVGTSLLGDQQLQEGSCELKPSPLYAGMIALIASPAALAAAGTVGGFFMVCALVDRLHTPPELEEGEERRTAFGAVKRGMIETASTIFNKMFLTKDGKLHAGLYMGDEEALHADDEAPFKIEKIFEEVSASCVDDEAPAEPSHEQVVVIGSGDEISPNAEYIKGVIKADVNAAVEVKAEEYTDEFFEAFFDEVSDDEDRFVDALEEVEPESEGQFVDAREEVGEVEEVDSGIDDLEINTKIPVCSP